MKNLLRPTPSGIYCEDGDFFLDPMRPVNEAFTSHAHSDHCRPGSRHYLCASPGVELLRHRVRSKGRFTPIPYGHKIKRGNVWISFHPAGHILGSAQIRIESKNQVWVYSGDYKRTPDASCAPFESIECDVFVTEATFGSPAYEWDDADDVLVELYAWWQKNAKAGKASILSCYALGKTQRVLAELAKHTDENVYLHAAMEPLTGFYRDQGVEMLPTKLVSAMPQKWTGAGALILAPGSAFSNEWIERFPKRETANASGWMKVNLPWARNSYDTGFALSDHADWPQLLQTIRETKAKRVYVFCGGTKKLYKHLHGLGLDAAPFDALESPRPAQLSLL